MQSVRCSTCVGSGEILGGGMIFMDCPNCKGSGKVINHDNPIDYLNKNTCPTCGALRKIEKSDEDFLMDKGSPAYIKARDKIKNLASDMSDEEAAKILDEELEASYGKPGKKKGSKKHGEERK